MKNLKTIGSILIFTMFILTVTSCKNDTKKTDADNNMQHMETKGENHDAKMGHDKSDNHLVGNTQKNGATSDIIDSYLQIKNALVNDDKDGAAKSATIMLTAFSNFDMSQLSEGQHKEYMEILESVKEHAEHIVKSPLDHQREHFETMSTDINDLITLLGTDKTLYVDYCPMAKASWLSEIKDIKNPFYGSKMMTCGSVKSQIN